MNKIIKRFRVILPDHDVLQLHRNARPELYDSSIINLIRSSIPLEALSRYPDIEPFLIKLSNFININSDEIMLTSGIDGAIRAVFETLLTPGSNVAILVPTYKMYEIYAEAYGMNLKRIQSRQDLSIDINEILEAIPDNKIIFIPNPHEPVENVFSKEQMLDIIRTAATYNSIIVIDEAYFMFGAPTVMGMISQSNDFLIMRSFSKGFGLPAIRLGYIAGNKKLIAQMDSRRPAYETNSLSLWIATWALNNFSLFEDYIKEVISTRDFMKNDLINNGFKVHGSYSNTILINLESPEHSLEVHKKLRDRDIWVRELTEFPNISTWISVGIGKKDTANKFLEVFYSVAK